MFDKIKNIFKSDKEESNVTPKNAPKEVTVPAHKVGPKSQDDATTYVIIGASIAGVTAVKTIRELDKKAKIIVVSKDENIYSRCMLHHVISGHRTIEGINFVDGDFMEKQNATWIKKATVKEIDPDNKKIKYEKDGKEEELAYDKLLITSGANAFVPPVKNL